MHPLKTIAKRGASLFMLLGITSTIGALTHGNDPSKSLTLALVSFGVLVLLNLPKA